MRKASVLILCLCIATTTLADQKPRQITCRGTVVDKASRPIVGAMVKAYRIKHDEAKGQNSLHPLRQMKTSQDGAFTLNFSVEQDYARGFVVAFKEGRAIDWGVWQSRKKEYEFTLRLGKPSSLVGIIVDEAGAPIARAEVRAVLQIGRVPESHYIMGWPGFNRLIAHTGADGKFSFGSIPAEARADFLVSAPSRASITTIQRRAGSAPRTFAAGQSDIKITLPVEAKIEGVVVENGKPVGGVRLAASKEHAATGWESKTCESQKDGRFSLIGLQTGQYKLTIISPREGTADWVCTPVIVETNTGKTKSGVRILVGKGGILEVAVTDDANNKPLPNASVIVRSAETRQIHSGRTDKNGVARIRLLPGTHRILNTHKQGYVGIFQARKSVEIVEGRTQRLAFQLKVQPKISGIVLDQQGKPVSGASVCVLPGGSRGGVITGKDGKFEVIARLHAWPDGQEPRIVIVARHVQRNLAAAEEESEPVIIKLEPGATLVGQVTDPNGKPIPGARVRVAINHRSWSSPIQSRQLVTDAQGRYKIKAVPSGWKYTVSSQADGFGRMDVKIELDEDESGRVKVKPLVLVPANLSISGVVVDAEDKPMPNARVYIHSDRQPYRTTTTDKEGKFVLDKIVAGEIWVSARNHNQQERGRIMAKGGDKNVKIVLVRSSGSRPPKPKPKSILGKHLPKLETFNLKAASEVAAGKRLLVCFWDFEQRPSRRAIRILAAKADELAKKGVIVLSVQASATDKKRLQDWAAKYKVAFPIGMVRADEKKSRKILLEWNVGGLPWLILTDEKHMVRAEGFQLTELDKKLMKPVNK